MSIKNLIESRRLLQYAILAILIATNILLNFYSEISDLFDGAGSDGFYYAYWSSNFGEIISGKYYPREALGKIFPLSIPYLIQDTFFSNRDEVGYFVEAEYRLNIIYVYRCLSVLYTSLSLVLFYMILRKREYNSWEITLGMTLLFLNFMFLKQFTFEPVFLDQFTLFLAVLLLFSVEINNKKLQYVILFISIFSNFIVFVLTLYPPSHGHLARA